MCRSTVVKIFYSAAVTGALRARLVETSFCPLPLQPVSPESDKLCPRLPMSCPETIIGDMRAVHEGREWHLRAEHMRRRDILVAGLEQMCSDIDASLINQVLHVGKPANE